MYRFGDFTSRANTAINLAIKISGELGHTYVGSEHLLWGLCGEGSGVARPGKYPRGSSVNCWCAPSGAGAR